MTEKEFNSLLDISDEEIEREIEREVELERQAPQSREWEKWGLEGAKSFDNLITRATEIETNEPVQNITVKNAVHIIFDSMAKQTLQHYVEGTKVSDTYYRIRMGSYCPSDFELLEQELSTANVYKQSIERNVTFKKYTLKELLEQGFDESGNFKKNSPFQQDFLQAFHSLKANAEYTATKEYIEMLQRVIKSVSDADKEKAECPFIWNQLRKEWKQTQERLSYPMKIPLPKIIVPKTHTSPNTRVSNELDDLLNEGAFDLRVGAQRKRNELTAYVVVDYESSESVRFLGRRKYTEYDRQVYDAIVSLWMYGDKRHIITPATVFKAMTGARVKPSTQQKEAVTKSIENMRRIFAEVDATDEIKAYLKRKGIEPTKEISLKWNDTILSLRWVKMVKGKEIIEGYIIENEPLLLSYAKATDKLLTSPLALLDIKEVNDKGEILETSLPNTQPRIAIKGYLWRRIMVMKRDQNTKNPHQSKIIRFDSLFEKTGLQDESREIMRRNRNYIFQVLNFWKASGFIKDYSKRIGDNKVIESVEIKL